MTRSSVVNIERLRALIPFREFFCLHRKFLLYNFLSRNLKLKYRRSIFGYFWTLLIPLAQVAIYFFVYKVVLKVNIPNYISFIMTGILPWTFFAASLTESLESLVAGHQLLIHAPVPIQIFPASATFTNFFNFIISTPLILALIWFDTGTAPNATVLWFLPLSLCLCVFTYALGFLMATLFVYFRDLKHLIGLIVQLWLFVTPVLYKAEMTPEKYRWVMWLNPLTGYFVTVREVLLEGRSPDPQFMILFLVWTAGCLVLAELTRRMVGLTLVEKI